MKLKDIRRHLLEIGMPTEGINAVIKAASEAPVRTMHGHGGSVRVEFPSAKMGCTMVCESRTVEYEMALELERDPDVLAYWLQPMTLELELASGKPGASRITITPDALIVTRTAVYLDEWKPTDRCERLPSSRPNRYRVDAEGHVISPPAIQKVSPWGITFRVRHPGHLPAKYLENLEYLRDYADAEAPALPDELKQRITGTLAQCAFGTLRDLIACDPSITVDHWLRAIVEGVAVVDLRNDRLAEQHTAFVYRDELTMHVMQRERQAAVNRQFLRHGFDLARGMTFLLDGKRYEVQTVGNTEALVHDDDGLSFSLKIAALEQLYLTSKLHVESIPSDGTEFSALAEAVRTATPEEVEDAQRKLAIAEGEEPAGDVPSRTLREWRRLIAQARLQGDDPLAALIPARIRQGNRSARICDKHAELITDVLNEYYYVAHRPTLTSAYKIYEAKAIKKKWTPLSRQALGLRAKASADDKANLARYGKRMANARKPAHVALGYKSSVHGNRPFGVVHIDHTQADIELCSEHDGQPLGRPWLSIAFDATTRVVLAWVLSFRAPDTHTVMLLTREMVRRHQRLPATLVLDNGADLRSASLRALCSHYNVHPRRRPPGQPRYGSVIEREFGTISTQFFHRLRGSTLVMKQVRTVTGSHLPEKITRWHLRHLKTALGAWFEDVYHQQPHKGLEHQTPAKAMESGLVTHGSRSHRRVRMDETFYVLTCPFVKDMKGMRTIDRASGVKVGERRYHATGLMDPKLHRTRAAVRYDPANFDHVFVQVGREWIECWRIGNAEMRGMNEFETALYTEQLLQRRLLSKEHRNDLDRIAREAHMTDLVQQLEADGHALFRRLREENLLSEQNSASAARPAARATARTELPVAMHLHEAPGTARTTQAAGTSGQPFNTEFYDGDF